VTPFEAIANAERESLEPVYLLLGEERFLQGKVLEALRKAVIGAHDLGLNEDHVIAGETDVDRVIAAAKTLPMMAPRRLIVVRSLERWEPKGEERAGGESALDRLAAYAQNPAPSSVVVLVAAKLDGRRRLVTVAKQRRFLVACDPLSRAELPQWAESAARQRGKKLSPGTSDLLVELLGPELSPIDDAIERLSLYVGDAVEISEEAIAECVVQVKPSTVWELVGAVGRRDVGTALSSLARVYDPQDRGLRLLGVLAWSIRQLLRFAAATAEGAIPAEAAKRAGAPPFKANDLARQVRGLSQDDLAGYLQTLAAVDLALKGGSRRPPQAVLEAAIISLCTSRQSESSSRAARGGP
jgi:DNA polymerase-3 subunit delta